jgi:curved DNA-binding protein CbpA
MREAGQASPTYYDVLAIAPAATDAEVELACDAFYEKWHRLVTHHELADQATQALRTIETIRSVLLDPKARAAYDAGIGLGGSVGGLMDPELLAPRTSPPAMAMPPPTATMPPIVRSPEDLWTCPACGARNIERAKFCANCGEPLIRECLACGQMTSLVATGRCWECRAQHEEELAKREAAELAGRQAEQEREQASQRDANAYQQWLESTLQQIPGNAVVRVVWVNASAADVTERMAGSVTRTGLLLSGDTFRFYVISLKPERGYARLRCGNPLFSTDAEIYSRDCGFSRSLVVCAAFKQGWGLSALAGSAMCEAIHSALLKTFDGEAYSA